MEVTKRMKWQELAARQMTILELLGKLETLPPQSFRISWESGGGSQSLHCIDDHPHMCDIEAEADRIFRPLVSIGVREYRDWLVAELKKVGQAGAELAKES